MRSIEMIDFRARHDFVADVELTQIKKINEAHERMLKCGISIALFIDLACLNKIMLASYLPDNNMLQSSEISE
jgi:hypothetical protein